MEFRSRISLPQWPFLPDDEVTESGCVNVRTKYGRRLSLILKDYRTEGTGPKYRTETLSGATRRLYKWHDITEWLANVGDHDPSLLYFDPTPTVRRYLSEDPEISQLRDAYASERRRRLELERELSRANRPRSAPGLLDAETIVSISRVFEMPCGVYFLIEGDEIVYVGQSVNINQRLLGHFPNKEFSRVAILPVPPDRLEDVEREYINHLAPRYNKTVPWQQHNTEMCEMDKDA